MPGALLQAFAERLGGRPDFVVRAPGRVNLIGEHTDYNDGLVLPMAIDLDLQLAARRRTDRRVRLWSQNAPEAADFSLDRLAADDHAGGWTRYAAGVARALDEAGWAIAGLEGLISSNIPLGGGLSSSAALELAVARALVEASGQTPWDAVEAAKICQRAENLYAGAQCGLMDQLTVALGRREHALLIDCRSLAVEPIHLPSEVAMVICDSGKSRELASSAYNERRAECAEAARLLHVASLRDATIEGLAEAELPDTLARRARHVVQENARVQAAARALAVGDIAAAGRLMLASHHSLRDLFEVSCRELDTLVEIACQLPGCCGARLTGAGFGGCTVNLVAVEATQAFQAELLARYRQRMGLEGWTAVCRPSDGLGLA